MQAIRVGSRERLVDVLVATALSAIVVASVVTKDPAVTYEFREPNAWLVGLALAASLPLAVRRRWPLTVVVITAGAAFVIAALRWNTGATPFCLMLALYALAAWRDRLAAAVAGLAVVYAAMGGLALLRAPYFDHPFALVSAVAVTVAWAVGRVMRRWRRAREMAVVRALTAERTRAVTAERAVFAERLRIARELHDVVSHTLSVIAVQSGVARHQLGAQESPARSALAAIEDASRTALDDLRRMLGLLRAESATGPAAGAAPPPGLAERDPLAAAHRSAHGPGDLTVDPAAESTPQSLRLTAYRLVQEALTNVRRFAPGASTRVIVSAEGGDVVVQVDDDGPARTSGEDQGFGLVGMRERVTMFGGSLHAGPREEGGFQVRAILRATTDRIGVPEASEADSEDERGAARMPPTAKPASPAPPRLVWEWLVDAVVAVALGSLALSSAFVKDPSVAYEFADANGWLVLLVLSATLPLAVRRRWPFGVLAVTTGAAFLTASAGWDHDVPFFCACVALYTVAAWRQLPTAVAGLALLIGAQGALMLVPAPHYDFLADLTGAGALIPWGLGLIVRRWRRDREAATTRALEAERTRAVVAERAVFADRLRIARELHDVVSHTLSVIAVQSGVARHQFGTQPSPARSALAAIEEASRTALDDLRRMLGVLRVEPDDTAGSLAPSPGLAEMRLLASAHRAAHGPIELTVDPAVESAPESLRLTAYRLVQEALTNVRKHAPAASTQVNVYTDSGGVVVQIDNDGGPDQGCGLTGMRERVALFNGSLSTTPREGGGFQVRAVLRATTDRGAVT